MAFTRKARKALRQSRQQAGGSYVQLLKKGEDAARKGLSLDDNPYVDREDREIWAEGYTDYLGSLADLIAR